MKNNFETLSRKDNGKIKWKSLTSVKELTFVRDWTESPARAGWSLCSTVLHCRLKGFPEMLTQHLSFFYQFNYMLNFGFIKRLSGYHNQCYSNGAPSNTVNHHSEKKLPGFVQNRNNILLKRPAHSQQRPSFSNRHWADQEGQGQ